MFNGAWKKYINLILIIITGAMLIMSITSHTITMRTVAEDGALTPNQAEADDEGGIQVNLDGEGGDEGSTEGEDAASQEGAGNVELSSPEEEQTGGVQVTGQNEDNGERETEGVSGQEGSGEGTESEGATPEKKEGENTEEENAEEEDPEKLKEDGSTEDEENNDEDECICTALCTSEEHNEECPVCAEDYEACKYVEPVCTCTALCSSEEFDETCPVCSKNFNDCKYEEEKECLCEQKCEEGDVNLSCPVCSEDYTLCEGDELDYAAVIHYTLDNENKKEKFLTLGEALNGAKAVSDLVRGAGDTTFVPVIEIKDELTVSATITVENNCSFIIDLKGHRITLESGAYLNFGSSNIIFRDTNASSINYGGDNVRPGGVAGTSGRLFSGSSTITFTTGYYSITSGIICSGFSDVTVNDAYLINSSGSLFNNACRFVVNNGFFIYDSVFSGESEGSIVTPTSMVLAEKTILIGGHDVRGYGLTTAVFKVTLQMVSSTDYYYSTFAEAFSAAENISKSNDGAKTIISINDAVVSSVAISQTYTLTGVLEGYNPVVQINNITFTRGSSGDVGFDGTMFAVNGGELILSDCSVNGYISESQVAVSSMITVESGAALTLVGSTERGTNLNGNVALLGATASDPAAGVFLKNGGKLKVSGYITINNNISYSETPNQDGEIDVSRTNRNLYMDRNSEIEVIGTLLRTETFLIGVTPSTDTVDEDEPIGSLATDYYNGLVAAGVSTFDLSSFYMDTSAAYAMTCDFDENVITWSRGDALLPEAGIMRIEYVLLFIGLIGFIFRAAHASGGQRKEVINYITVMSVAFLLVGSAFGVYHVRSDRELIRRNNEVLDSMAGSMGNGQLDGNNLDFENQEEPVEIITTVEDTTTIKTVEEVAPKQSIVPVDGREYIGIIEVESLNIKLPVLSTYTDADMKTTPCVYYGTRENMNLVIVGHNYNSQFGDFNGLNGSETIKAKLTMADGTEYEYTSKLLENLNPDQIDEMLTGDWDLTLFTCSYSGDKRIAIRFDLAR